MLKDKTKALSDAISIIQDGDLLVTGGWAITSQPIAAIYEIIRQKKRNLILSCSATGTASDLLIGGGTIGMVEGAYHKVCGLKNRLRF